MLRFQFHKLIASFSWAKIYFISLPREWLVWKLRPFFNHHEMKNVITISIYSYLYNTHHIMISDHIVISHISTIHVWMRTRSKEEEEEKKPRESFNMNAYYFYIHHKRRRTKSHANQIHSNSKYINMPYSYSIYAFEMKMVGHFPPSVKYVYAYEYIACALCIHCHSLWWWQSQILVYVVSTQSIWLWRLPTTVVHCITQLRIYDSI